MKKPAKIRGVHHWWPESLSSFWLGEDGRFFRIDATGNVIPATPPAQGCIAGGHDFVLGADRSGDWAHTFEHCFNTPDSDFPQVVRWLTQLCCAHRSIGTPANHFAAHSIQDRDGDDLRRCLISLAVRSPKFRNGVVQLVTSLRSNVHKTELRALVALNLGQSYEHLVNEILGTGKLAVIFSDSREFIFGDGFYHNLTAASQYAVFSRILAPLTPEIAVLFVCPMAYRPDPSLVTLEANDELVDMINSTVQIYAKDYLYFRREKPVLKPEFTANEHLVIQSGDPVDNLVESLPGIEDHLLIRTPRLEPLR